MKNNDLSAVVWARQLASTGAARATRQAARLSLADVARVLGVEPSTVSRWERGERSPRAELAVRWARLLRGLQ